MPNALILRCAKLALSLGILSGLSGCLGDYLPNPKALEEKERLEAVAVGSGCRQAGRSIEHCYEKHETMTRAGIYQGWRDMDEYMRLNKLDTQAAKDPIYGADRGGEAKPAGAAEAASEPASGASAPQEVLPAPPGAQNRAKRG